MAAFTQGQQFSFGSPVFHISIDQIKTGDFNGDGKVDIAVARINWTGYFPVANNAQIPAPFQVLVGDGCGNFADQTALLFNGSIPSTSYVPRMLIADVNSDGVDDIFCIDNGDDRSPWPGEKTNCFCHRMVTWLTLVQTCRKS